MAERVAKAEDGEREDLRRSGIVTETWRDAGNIRVAEAEKISKSVGEIEVDKKEIDREKRNDGKKEEDRENQDRKSGTGENAKGQNIDKLRGHAS